MSRNFERRVLRLQIGEIVSYKQQLVDPFVEVLCVHILQHMLKKDCDKESSTKFSFAFLSLNGNSQNKK